MCVIVVLDNEANVLLIYCDWYAHKRWQCYTHLEGTIGFRHGMSSSVTLFLIIETYNIYVQQSITSQELEITNEVRLLN